MFVEEVSFDEACDYIREGREVYTPYKQNGKVGCIILNNLPLKEFLQYQYRTKTILFIESKGE